MTIFTWNQHSLQFLSRNWVIFIIYSRIWALPFPFMYLPLYVLFSIFKHIYFIYSLQKLYLLSVAEINFCFNVYTPSVLLCFSRLGLFHLMNRILINVFEAYLEDKIYPVRSCYIRINVYFLIIYFL